MTVPEVVYYQRHMTSTQIRSEQGVMTEMIERLAKKLDQPVLPIRYRIAIGLDFGITTTRLDRKYESFYYRPGVTHFFTMEMLEGIFAHEYGHLTQNDGRSGPGQSERLADQYAAEHGFAAANIDALRRIMELEPISERFRAEAALIHGSDEERIAFFERYLPRAQGAGV